MTIDTTRIALAEQMAGQVPQGAEIIGLVTESDDYRNYSALVRMRTGIYVTIAAHTTRSLDPRVARAAIAAAAS